MLNLFISGEYGNKTYALVVDRTANTVDMSVYRDGGKTYVAAMQIPLALFVRCYKRRATAEETEGFLAERRKVLKKYGVEV